MEQQQAEAHNSVHVIQIGNSFYDVIPIRRCQHSNSRCRGYHIRHSESNASLSNSHVNPTFVLDEGVYPSAPASHLEAPPTYEEVLRLPNQYPKRNNLNTSNINPPALAEIENNHSIMTITPQTPAIFTTNASQQQIANGNSGSNANVEINNSRQQNSVT
ncbi:hypothetical protein PVAND_007600 [Polypedilum vanderplanki]|uniref:Uncharacterized protein n=1 Tax=Polypedilum vanderplanki TaxID=319348 RepID=A0A9J6C7U7_POLVA|nr:hypothetical protein PVAND_007600 [Polypedilum vanderplanki]